MKIVFLFLGRGDLNMKKKTNEELNKHEEDVQVIKQFLCISSNVKPYLMVF